MRLRLSLLNPSEGSAHDVELTCDEAVTVGEVARALEEFQHGAAQFPAPTPTSTGEGGNAGPGSAVLQSPLTLAGLGAGAAEPWIFDRMAPLAEAGVLSGWAVWPVREADPDVRFHRVTPCAGWAEVLTGPQTGFVFALAPGENLIGRDVSCRVRLSDSSVSRRHAVVSIGKGVPVVRDLGSVNGTVLRHANNSEANDRETVLQRPTPVADPVTLRLGEVTILVTPGPPQTGEPGVEQLRESRVLHTRSPRLVPRFTPSERTLPAPPVAGPRSRIPTIALLMPMLMGGAMFLFTQSPMSLMMMAFTPLMMLGSWADGTVGGRRRNRQELRRYRVALAAERDALDELRAEEIRCRSEETPTLARITQAVERRDELLWGRQAEDAEFLRFCPGVATQPSLTRIKLPPQSEKDVVGADGPAGSAGNSAQKGRPANHSATHNARERLLQLEEEFTEVGPLPVAVSLRDEGAFGISGPTDWATALARSVLLQLAALHTPEELQLVCIAPTNRAADWAWMRWLPHVAPPGATLSTWPLAAEAAAIQETVSELEREAERRSEAQQQDQGGLGAHGSSRQPAIVVLVVEEPGSFAAATHSRLMQLAATGGSLSIHFVWLAPHVRALPSACTSYAEVEAATATVSSTREAARHTLSRVDFADPVLTERLARLLAPIEDRAAKTADAGLPASVDLRDLTEHDIAGGAAPVLETWRQTRSIMRDWHEGERPQPTPTGAVVGAGAAGPVSLDLRQHGPHALVGGTTGAGKSEFLQTWILSLAASLSPDRCTFLLVDYKGGAAFAECVALPHTVGLVTDLTPALVRRALISLRAELRHREALLNAFGAKDIVALERQSHPRTPPMLVIVVDEFAALAAEHPDFVAGVLDVAQRGRSLGLHLILATQRPAGVITDALRANTNLRIALRMADTADSLDVVGTAEAAQFRAETPGRAVCSIAAAGTFRFQAGYLGGVRQKTGATLLEVRSLGFGLGEPWRPTALLRRSANVTTGSPRDIDLVCAGIAAAAAEAGVNAPRKPWLEPLPPRIALTELRAQVGETSFASSAHSAPAKIAAGKMAVVSAVTVGMRDQPALQRQTPFEIVLEAAGTCAFFGAGGTGKTTALQTIACALGAAVAAAAVTATADSSAGVQILAIDAAGGALQAMADLPWVSVVAPISDTELVTRVLLAVRERISVRSARAGVPTPSGAGEVDSEPPIVLMIDGFTAYRQTMELLKLPASLRGSPAVGRSATTSAPGELLQEIMQMGRSVGVYVVLTADRPMDIPAQLATHVQQQVVLRLAQPQDYSSVSAHPDMLQDAGPGRGIALGGIAHQAEQAGGAGSTAMRSEQHRASSQNMDEVQLAVPEHSGETRVQAFARYALQYREAGCEEAPCLTNSPTRLRQEELPASVAGQPVIGLDTRTFDPVTFPTSGLVVVTGPASSGVTTTVRGCATAVAKWAGEREETCELILLSCGGRIQAAAEPWVASPEWSLMVTEESEFAEVVQQLTGRNRENSEAGTRPSPMTCVVVERPGEVDTPAAVTALATLAGAARKGELLVVFEWQVGALSGGGATWELLGALKQPTWGIALQPDDADGQTPLRESFGRITRTDLSEGRGFAVCRGRITPVQVAIPGGLE